MADPFDFDPERATLLEWSQHLHATLDGAGDHSAKLHQAAQWAFRETNGHMAFLCAALRTLRNEAHYWSRTNPNGRPFTDWASYCQHPRPQGLGIPVQTADHLIEALSDTYQGGTFRPVLCTAFDWLGGVHHG